MTKSKRYLVLVGLASLCVGGFLAWPTEFDHARSSRAEAVDIDMEPVHPPRLPHSQPTPPGASERVSQSIIVQEFDGEVVAGLAVRLRIGDEVIDAATDESGEVELLREDGGTLRMEALDDGWHLAKSEFEQVASPISVVAYRQLQVHGLLRVMENETLDFATVRVGFGFGGPRDGEEDGVARLHRLIRVGLPHEGKIVQAGADGTFTGTLPRVDGFVVHATAPGWHAESVPVATGHESDRVSVVLELRKGTRLRGRLVDDAGRAVPTGTVVQIFITMRGDPETLAVEEAYRLRGSARCGMTCGISEKHGESVVCFVYQRKRMTTESIRPSCTSRAASRFVPTFPDMPLRLRVETGFRRRDRAWILWRNAQSRR